jgi:hypothetical protein
MKKIYAENNKTEILPKIASIICIVPPFIASHQNAIEKLKFSNKSEARTISMMLENRNCTKKYITGIKKKQLDPTRKKLLYSIIHIY